MQAKHRQESFCDPRNRSAANLIIFFSAVILYCLLGVIFGLGLALFIVNTDPDSVNLDKYDLAFILVMFNLVGSAIFIWLVFKFYQYGPVGDQPAPTVHHLADEITSRWIVATLFGELVMIIFYLSLMFVHQDQVAIFLPIIAFNFSLTSHMLLYFMKLRQLRDTVGLSRYCFGCCPRFHRESLYLGIIVLLTIVDFVTLIFMGLILTGN